jgi:hypothetical protein
MFRLVMLHSLFKYDDLNGHYNVCSMTQATLVWATLNGVIVVSLGRRGGDDGGGIVCEYHLKYCILQTYMHILNTLWCTQPRASIVEIDHIINRDGKICTLHVPLDPLILLLFITSLRFLLTTNAHLNISSLAIQHNRQLWWIGIQ